MRIPRFDPEFLVELDWRKCADPRLPRVSRIAARLHAAGIPD